MKLRYEQDPDYDVVWVEGQADCGQHVGYVAKVFEPKSQNPGLAIRGDALGFDAVEQIIEFIREQIQSGV